MTVHLGKRQLTTMKKKFEGVKHVLIHIDGACNGNPGPGAGSACFFSIDNSPHLKEDTPSSDFEGFSSSSDSSSDEDGEILRESTMDEESHDLTYLCSCSINLNHTTNNIAEYTGLLLGLMICSINKIDYISIRTDSDLMVK